MTLESPQARIGAAATEIFLSRPQNCAEAVVLALNRHLTGGLAPAQAAGVASGFSLGLGGAGCLCGALSGATLCIGLFLAPKGDRLERRAARKAAKALHHSFLELHGSVCCRELCPGPGRRNRDPRKTLLRAHRLRRGRGRPAHPGDPPGTGGHGLRPGSGPLLPPAPPPAPLIPRPASPRPTALREPRKFLLPSAPGIHYP
jgi:C_GCAxxG_C_C family probable redox protein